MIEKEVFETSFPVRYAESDQMGVAHHSNYIVWMEEGRSQYMRAKGLGYEDIERGGAFMAVTEVNVRYVAPARYGDHVTVRTWIDEVRSRTLSFGYELLDTASRMLLATGRIKLIWIDRHGRVIKMPKSVRVLLPE